MRCGLAGIVSDPRPATSIHKTDTWGKGPVYTKSKTNENTSKGKSASGIQRQGHRLTLLGWRWYSETQWGLKNRVRVGTVGGTRVLRTGMG
jgi:hypothetical protein